MSFRDKLDHIIYAYDSISCFRPATSRDFGVIFKFLCWVKQNKDPNEPERLEEMAFKISSILTENLVRHLFCFDYDDTTIIDYHYDDLVWVKNYLINHFYYPPNFADALVPKLAPRVPRRMPRMLSLRITTEVYRRGPKNMNYPPLEVDLDSGRVEWLVRYPGQSLKFVEASKKAGNLMSSLESF